jgi:isocitrate dehydrogenase
MEKAFESGKATNDLARFMPDGSSLTTSEFRDLIVSII